jgi:hypothetical protein
MDEEPDHQIVHGRRFREANGTTGEPLDPRAQMDVFTFDFLCTGLAHCVLRGVDMALVGAPPIGVEAVDAKQLEHRFELQKDVSLRRPKTYANTRPLA